MAVRQEIVIERLKAGETMFRVLDHVNGEFRPYQWLSGGGASNGRNLRETHEWTGCTIDSGMFWPVSGCGPAGMGVA